MYVGLVQNFIRSTYIEEKIHSISEIRELEIFLKFSRIFSNCDRYVKLSLIIFNLNSNLLPLSLVSTAEMDSRLIVVHCSGIKLHMDMQAHAHWTHFCVNRCAEYCNKYKAIPALGEASGHSSRGAFSLCAYVHDSPCAEQSTAWCSS